MKTTRLLCIASLCLNLLSTAVAPAADLTPDYQRAITLSREHADSPSGWAPNSAAGDKQVFTITGNPATENAAFGLKYDSAYGDGKDYLIVRTLTKSNYFSSNYVNQSGYSIKGGPATTNAAWVTTGNDATKFLQDNGGTSANIVKLMERGLGMNNDGSHTAIVEYAVIADNDHILRPTKNPDIKSYSTHAADYGTHAAFAAKPADMSQATYDKYVGGTSDVPKGYYQYWKEKTYDSDVTSRDAFPWTQLGYTFLWGNGGETLNKIQGMSEFIIPGETPVQIYGIYAPQSYIYTLNKNDAFSTATDAQYGNGFASFKIDGACDTVWAGHRFQRNVRTDASDGNRNQIRIESSGSVSGGQGLLVWSLNYDVVNNGSISGATAAKFGISGTDNIAVLFKGDTSNNYGTPIATAGANNRLTNAGTISSPGIAVKAEAGDTVITNNAGGVISGGTYAIQSGSGNDTVTVKGGEVSGKIDLGTGTDKLDVTGADGNAKLSFTLNKDTASTPQVAVRDGALGTVNIADNTTVAVTMAGTKNIQNSDRFLLVDTNALTVTPANLTVQNDPNLPQVAFSAVKSDDGKQLYLLASRNGSYYGTNSGNASLGNLLDRLANSATGDLSNALGDLDKSGSAAAARKLEPTVNRGTIQAGFGTATQFTQTIVNRVGRVWSGTDVTGIATGDEEPAWGVWGQAFGAYLNQAAAGSSNGYTANVWGGTIGFDRRVYNHALIGLSGGYARNAIRTADEQTRTDADSYQGSAYGSLTRDAFTVTGLLSYAYNRYDASRHIAFGTTNRTAKSRYDGQQYTGYAEGGYTMKNHGFLVTPLVSMQYMRLHLGDYAESGADSLNLAVDAQRYQMFQTGLGAKLAYPIRHRDAQILPELHARWLYDFVGDPQQATASFSGSASSGAFVTRGIDPPKSSYQLGAKISLLTANNLAVAINYDFDFKENFYKHSGYVNVRCAF